MTFTNVDTVIELSVFGEGFFGFLLQIKDNEAKTGT